MELFARKLNLVCALFKNMTSLSTCPPRHKIIGILHRQTEKKIMKTTNEQLNDYYASIYGAFLRGNDTWFLHFLKT